MNGTVVRKISAAVAALACVSFSGWASATIYYVSGTVQLVMAQDSGFGANSDWFSLNGVAPHGTCPGGGGTTSNMVIAMKDDQYGSRQYAFVLAAFMTGTSLTVRVDDANKNAGGGCYAEFIW
jgi:hypothetical protein